MSKVEKSQRSERDEKSERKYLGIASRARPTYANDSKSQESSYSTKSRTTSISEEEIKTCNFAPPRSHPSKFIFTTPETAKKWSFSFDAVDDSRELMDVIEKLMEKTCILKGRILDSISSFQSELFLYSNKLSSRSNSGESHKIRSQSIPEADRIPGGAEDNLEEPSKITDYSDLANKLQKIQEDLADLRSTILESKREVRGKEKQKVKKQTKSRRSTKSESVLLEDIKEEDDDSEANILEGEECNPKKYAFRSIMCRNLKCDLLKQEEENCLQNKKEVDNGSENNSDEDEEEDEDDADKNESPKRATKDKTCQIHLHASSSCSAGQCIRIQDICKILGSQIRERAEKNRAKCTRLGENRTKTRIRDNRGYQNECAPEKYICENCHRVSDRNIENQNFNGSNGNKSDEIFQYPLLENCERDEPQLCQNTPFTRDKKENCQCENVDVIKEDKGIVGENRRNEETVKPPICPLPLATQRQEASKCHRSPERSSKHRKRCPQTSKSDRDNQRECPIRSTVEKERRRRCSERRQSGGNCNAPSSSKSVKNPSRLEERLNTAKEDKHTSIEVSRELRKKPHQDEKREQTMGSLEIHDKSEKSEKLAPVVVPAHGNIEESLPAVIKKCSDNRPVDEFFLSICPGQIRQNTYRVNVMDRRTGDLLGYFFIDETKFNEAHARGIFDDYLSVFILNSFKSYKSFKTAFKHQYLTDTDES